MKRHRIPLNALRAFEATARLGRMQDAAAELHVTHSAISRQVRNLEDILGIQLFVGPRNNLQLSEAAASVLPQITEAFQQLETAVSQLMQTQIGLVRISCLGTLLMRWLIPRLEDFHNTFPNIDLQLSADDKAVDFHRSSLDLAIRVAAEFPDHASVHYMFPDLVGPVLSPELSADHDVNSPETLTRLPLLHTQTRPTAWSDWAASHGISLPKEGQCYEHFYFMLEAVAAGLGVAIAPYILVHDDLKAGRLVAPLGFSPSGMNYAILIRAELSPSARTFIEWLLELSHAEKWAP